MEWHEWLVVIAAIIIVIGYLAWRFWGDLTFSGKASIARGTIVNWFASKEKGKEYFYPLIEFISESGDRISLRAEDRCEGKPMYSPGTEVTVKYLPKDPKKVRITYPARA